MHFSWRECIVGGVTFQQEGDYIPTGGGAFQLEGLHSWRGYVPTGRRLHSNWRGCISVGGIMFQKQLRVAFQLEGVHLNCRTCILIGGVALHFNWEGR